MGTDLDKWSQAFQLSNSSKGSAKEIIPVEGKKISDYLNLSKAHGETNNFRVFFDDLELFRPILFKSLPRTDHAIKHPLIFLGKCREEFSKIDKEYSAGPLAFEAYLFWNSKIAPVEHQGSLIRIHGSSGTLFDSTFMKYPVAEQTRLRQITCEIFVSEGLDSALNIDRESFNNAHPHTVFITKWLHSALRQLATVQKRIGSETREVKQEKSKFETVSKINSVAKRVWEKETGDTASSPPVIVFSSENGSFLLPDRSIKETYVFTREKVLKDHVEQEQNQESRKPKAQKSDAPKKKSRTQKSKRRDAIVEVKVSAIAQVLASFNLLDSVPKKKQELLLQAIYEILKAPNE